MSRPPSTLFEDAVDIPAWLEADRAVPLAERMRRDRAIALELGTTDRSIEAVRRWWRRVAPTQPGQGARLERARRLVGLGIGTIGVVAGVSVALAAFQYDGTHPVNVVRVVALLIVLPVVLLVPTLLLAVPGGPLRPLQDALASINVGASAGAIARRIAGPSPELERLFDFGAARAGATRRFAKWQMLYWSQLAGVCFALGALATAIALVTFTDLAFGWSTTLAVDAATVASIVDAIAAPWRRLAPAAVPSLALIEQSQYFRFEGGRGATGLEPATLTEWWPFLLFAITTYALLPRLVLLVLAGARLRAATKALLYDDPRVSALLDRMTAPDIESASPEPERPGRPEPVAAATAGARPAGRAHAVIWGAAVAPAEADRYARRLGLELVRVAAAGGSRELAADRAALDALGGDAQTLLVLTPAWEPPLLEFLDFLGELRCRVGDDASIVVVPVGEHGGAPSEVERETWSRAVGRVADRRLYVEAGAA